MSFHITINKSGSPHCLPTAQSRLLTHMSKTKPTTAQSVATRYKVSDRTARKWLNNLVRLNLVKKCGCGPHTHYHRR